MVLITAADPAKNLTDFRVLKISAGGMGGAVSPPAGPGQSSGGGPRGEAPGSSEDRTISTLKKRPKIHFHGAFFCDP